MAGNVRDHGKGKAQGTGQPTVDQRRAAAADERAAVNRGKFLGRDDDGARGGRREAVMWSHEFIATYR